MDSPFARIRAPRRLASGAAAFRIVAKAATKPRLLVPAEGGHTDEPGLQKGTSTETTCFAREATDAVGGA